MKAFSLCAVLFLVFSLCGCKTITNLVEAGGNVLDGSAFLKKTQQIYREAPYTGDDFELRLTTTKAGERGVQFKFNRMPELVFYAALSGNEESEAEGSLKLTGMRFLGGNLGGWVEFYQELSGEAVFTADDEGNAVFTVKDGVTEGAITEAALRLKASRLQGKRALGIIINRRDRITACVDWMKAQNAPFVNDRKEFEKYWKARLFPELVWKKQKPEEYTALTVTRKDFVIAEDVRWNIVYSEKYFPEVLALARNSGSLLRDWEEACPWFYMEYFKDTIYEYLYQQKNLLRKL